VPPPPTVYIVEDETSLRHGLERLLRALGFEVEAFASAEEVLRRLEAGSLHCTVLRIDIHLGSMRAGSEPILDKLAIEVLP